MHPDGTLRVAVCGLDGGDRRTLGSDAACQKRSIFGTTFAGPKNSVSYAAVNTAESSVVESLAAGDLRGNQLYMYRLKGGSTIRISTDPNADYNVPPQREDAELETRCKLYSCESQPYLPRC